MLINSNSFRWYFSQAFYVFIVYQKPVDMLIQTANNVTVIRKNMKR